MFKENSICFFASYFEGKSIPYYVRVYLKELKIYIKELIFINDRSDLEQGSLDFLKENNIVHQIEKNEGFDFGVWYKTFQKMNMNAYDHVFLVNDSCIVFRSLKPFFDWAADQDADVLGMTCSEAVTLHVQSYFMILNKKAIAIASDHFKKHGVKQEIGDVIKTYELGLNRQFTETGLKLASFVHNNGYKGEFSPYYKCVDDHLHQNIPLIKKKILFASYRPDELSNLARLGLNIDVKHYYAVMKNKKDLIIDLDKLQKENPSQMNASQISAFNSKKVLIKFLRPLYKAFKK
jgi:hypothetical protein